MPLTVIIINNLEEILQMLTELEEVSKRLSTNFQKTKFKTNLVTATHI